MKLILRRIFYCIEMSSKFGLIKQIDVDNISQWQDKIYLSFDIDWAHDYVIDYLLQILDKYHVSATLFATHRCGSIQNILQNPEYDVGLHPNFNNLLQGNSNGSSYLSICDDLKEIFPQATSVRSHSLCFGSLIQVAYEKLGLTHDSSILLPYQNNDNPVYPWKMWDGLIRVPYFFCDYVTAMTTDAPMDTLVARPGLKVFDFHPIHVFLNTESLQRYERTRSFHHQPAELTKHIYHGYGTHSRLIELLEIISDL